ncbi:hypothetical protein NX059_002557 [Plenodomus lindquistii]|nr:hypothetical protein NX059_002557 [Plenodomus lindquistii]
MKLFTTLVHLSSIVALTLATAVAQEVSTDIVMETPCQWCSKVYNDCKSSCLLVPEECETVCKKQACFSYINGKTCSELCLWYC